MATNIDQPGAADVANSLLFGDGLRVPQRVGKDAREGSIWPLIGPTVLVLALLVLATAYAGAFKVCAVFALVAAGTSLLLRETRGQNIYHELHPQDAPAIR